MIDPAYASTLVATPAALARETARIHLASNRVWPRRWGTTPWGVAAVISSHAAARGVRYGWRTFRGRRDTLADVVAALDRGWPVALLIGRLVPRHWVLLTGHRASVFRVYNPASGRSRDVTADEMRRGAVPLTFRRAFAVVLPGKLIPVTGRPFR
jgi:hypothetical protein